MPVENSVAVMDETKPMTLDVKIGPISFKVTDVPFMHTILVTQIVQSFIKNGIIAATMGPTVMEDLENKMGAIT